MSFERRTSRAVYACGVLLDLLGVRWHEVEPGVTADLGYGDGSAARVVIPSTQPETWDEPRPQVAKDEAVPMIHPASAPPRPRVDGGLGFDVLYAAYACLTAPWEGVDPANEVATPIAASSWLAAEGLLGRPLVHEYAALLAEALGIEPTRRTPTLVLTHDVDEHFGHLFGVRESWTRLVRDARRGSPATLRRAGGLVRRAARRGTDPNDRWDEWREFAGHYGGRSTFFVASFNYFDEGAARFDVGYDVRHPAVAREVRLLAESGAEIGIHFSLQSRRSAEQVRRERERLEEALGLEIRSARHHWWALGERPLATLRAQQEAGIIVDCSFGYNDLAGFRRGIAVPFHAFDTAAEAPLVLWSLPTVAMDKALVRPERSHDESLAELEELWATVSGVGGALVLDWHAHSLNPQVLAGAGRVLYEFVGRALERNVTVTTPLALVDQSAAT